MKLLDEYNKLLKVEVHFATGVWILTPREYRNGDPVSGRGEIKFRGEVEDFAKFLRKVKAKDSSMAPPSSRLKTYMKIAQEIMDKKDKFIWIWLTSWKPSTQIITLYTY